MVKKKIYITLFIFLGILVQQLVHGLIEIWYLDLLVSDFAKYGFGLSWGVWLWIHGVGAGILFILGVFFGFRQGKYWWKKIYE